MEFIFGLIGLVIGIILGIVVTRMSTDGVLKIDHSNPRKDLYRIEVDDIYNLPSKSRVVLRVEDNAYLSHE